MRFTAALLLVAAGIASALTTTTTAATPASTNACDAQRYEPLTKSSDEHQN